MAFQPGQSGNPSGRPRGAVNRQLALLRSAADQIIPKLVEQALQGDLESQKLVLQYSMPKLKPVSVPEPFTLYPGTLSEQIQSLLQQVANGEISSTAASQALEMVVAADKAQIIEVNTAEAKARRQTLSQAPSVGSTYLHMLHARFNAATSPEKE